MSAITIASQNTAGAFAPLEWANESRADLDEVAKATFAKWMVTEGLDEKEFTAKYFAPEGEQFMTDRLAATRRDCGQLIADEEKFVEAWFAAFPEATYAKPVAKEHKKKYGDKPMPAWRDNKIVQSIMRYDWLMTNVFIEYCKLRGLDRVPGAFYNAAIYSAAAKATYILKLLGCCGVPVVDSLYCCGGRRSQAAVDLIGLQETSEELYDLLAAKLPDSFGITAKAQSVTIWNRGKLPGLEEVKGEYPDVNNQTVYCRFGEYMLVNTHFTSKEPKKGPVNFKAQGAEMRDVMLQLQAAGYAPIVFGDFNHHFECAGFSCTTDPLGTDNKQRSYVQAQWGKMGKRVHTIKDCFLTAEGVTVVSSGTYLLNGERVGDERCTIPNEKHPADHFLMMLTVKL